MPSCCGCTDLACGDNTELWLISRVVITRTCGRTLCAVAARDVFTGAVVVARAVVLLFRRGVAVLVQVCKDSSALRFGAMSFFTGGFFLVELIVGIAIGSLSLQADAFHMASDLAALAIGYFAARLSKKKATAEASYGFVSVEIIGALVNAIFLLSVCFIVALEALQRFGYVHTGSGLVVVGTVLGSGGQQSNAWLLVLELLVLELLVLELLALRACSLSPNATYTPLTLALPHPPRSLRCGQERWRHRVNPWAKLGRAVDRGIGGPGHQPHRAAHLWWPRRARALPRRPWACTRPATPHCVAASARHWSIRPRAQPRAWR